MRQIRRRGLAYCTGVPDCPGHSRSSEFCELYEPGPPEEDEEVTGEWEVPAGGVPLTDNVAKGQAERAAAGERLPLDPPPPRCSHCGTLERVTYWCFDCFASVCRPCARGSKCLSNCPCGGQLHAKDEHWAQCGSCGDSGFPISSEAAYCEPAAPAEEPGGERSEESRKREDALIEMRHHWADTHGFSREEEEVDHLHILLNDAYNLGAQDKERKQRAAIRREVLEEAAEEVEMIVCGPIPSRAWDLAARVIRRLKEDTTDGD